MIAKLIICSTIESLRWHVMQRFDCYAAGFHPGWKTSLQNSNNVKKKKIILSKAKSHQNLNSGNLLINGLNSWSALVGSSGPSSSANKIKTCKQANKQIKNRPLMNNVSKNGVVLKVVSLFQKISRIQYLCVPLRFQPVGPKILVQNAKCPCIWNAELQQT